MAQVVDLTGRKFGTLSVLHRTENDAHGNARWLCACECGATVVAAGTKLIRGLTTGCGSCWKKEDLVGQTFGQITVIESLGVVSDFGQRGRGQVVRGVCACGKVWEGRADSLKKGNTKSCGCIPKGSVPNPDRGVVAARKVLSGYKRHAARRGFAWELSDQQFYALTQGACFYCGAPPSNVSCPNKQRAGGKHRKTISRAVYSGIDRKDNALGYTITNAVSCCATCNYAKRGLTAEAFLAHVKAIHRKHFGDDHG